MSRPSRILPPAPTGPALALAALTVAATLGACDRTTTATPGAAEAEASPESVPALPEVPTAPLAPEAAQAVASAQQLGDAFVAVAERVSPSVVAVRVEQQLPAGHPAIPFGMPFGGGDGPPPTQRGGGSGVVIRSDGYILTNNHVVDQATRIQVELHDRRLLPAEVVGRDEATDLAVLKVEASELPAAPFASSEAVRVGEWAMAVGSPFGLDYTVTTGVVSAVGRGLGANEIEDYVQTDASINPGNSGGPLVNLRGEVIGINTIIIGRGAGIGFAIPSDLARRVAGQLIESGEVRRAWIGVSFQELSPELAGQLGLADPTRPAGALVAEVVPGGPAAKAGVEPGDVIVKAGARSVVEGRDLLRAVLQQDVGSDIALEIVRDGATRTLSLTTEERPTRDQLAGRGPSPHGQSFRNASGEFGLELIPLNENLAAELGLEGVSEGLAIRNVRAGSPAERAGLMARDVIVTADREPVRTVADLTAKLSDGQALLRVLRGDGARFVVLSRE